MENKTTLDILNGGLMETILHAIEESGMSAMQASEVPEYLSAAIDSRNHRIFSNVKFSAVHDFP